MGKGDKKSKRGKIIMGSYGVSRPRRKITEKVVSVQAETRPEKPEVKVKAKAAAPKASEPKSKAPKKPKAAELPDSPIAEAQDETSVVDNNSENPVT